MATLDKVDVSKMEEKNNQKFGLCKSLIELGDWKMAKSIIDRYPLYCAVTDEKMARAICDRCHKIIEPLYRAKAAKKFAKQPDLIVNPLPEDLQVLIDYHRREISKRPVSILMKVKMNIL